MFEANDYEFPIGWDQMGEARWEEIQELEDEAAAEDDREPAETVWYDSFRTMSKQLEEALDLLILRLNQGYYDERPATDRLIEIEDPYENPLANREYATMITPPEPEPRLLPPEPLQIYSEEAKDRAITRLVDFRDVNDEIWDLFITILPGFYKMDLEDRPNTQTREDLDVFWSLLLDFIWVGRQVGFGDMDGRELMEQMMTWIYAVQFDEQIPGNLGSVMYDPNGKLFMLRGVERMYDVLRRHDHMFFEAATAAFLPPIDKSHPDLVEIWSLAKDAYALINFYKEKLGILVVLLQKLPQLGGNPQQLRMQNGRARNLRAHLGRPM
ncbi:hypothetical protein ABW20_dc0103728 [Dactylellina cionopaga]|nr:hypothetical protein ABW20_dc0103728 [Dactylellina cionopaga]